MVTPPRTILSCVSVVVLASHLFVAQVHANEMPYSQGRRVWSRIRTTTHGAVNRATNFITKHRLASVLGSSSLILAGFLGKEAAGWNPIVCGTMVLGGLNAALIAGYVDTPRQLRGALFTGALSTALLFGLAAVKDLAPEPLMDVGATGWTVLWAGGHALSAHLDD